MTAPPDAHAILAQLVERLEAIGTPEAVTALANLTDAIRCQTMAVEVATAIIFAAEAAPDSIH